MPIAGSPDLQTYVTVDDANTYHSARGNTDWTGVSDSPDQGKSAALIRASQAIDAIYRNKFPGQKSGGRTQTLEWPRVKADGNLVTDNEGFDIMDDEIPQEIFDATCEAALRELTDPGSLMPDLERGGAIRRLAAGSVEIEYQSNANPKTVFSIIDGIISGLIGPTGQGGVVLGRAVRG